MTAGASFTDVSASGGIDAREDITARGALFSYFGVLYLYDLVARFPSVRVVTFDPSVVGEPGAQASIALRVDVPGLWQKTADAPDTSWVQIAGGGAPTSSFVLTPAITPAAIGNVDNYAPTGASTSSRWRQALTTSAIVTGIAAISDGYVVVWENLDAARTVRLNHESASSLAANRIHLPTAESTIVDGFGSFVVVYDATTARWVLWSAATNTVPSLAVADGDVTIATGNLELVLGAVLVDAGDVTITVGSVAVTAGDITASSGTIEGATILADGLMAAAGRTTFTAVLSPTSITGAQNNYAPAGLLATSTLRQALGGAASLTGLTAGVAGQQIVVINIDTTNTLTIDNENASSTAANRFLTPNAAPLNVQPGGSLTVRYDSTSSRWRVVSFAAAPVSTASAFFDSQQVVAMTGPGTGTLQVNNWAPGTYGQNTLFRLTISNLGFSAELTGMVAGVDGEIVNIILVSSVGGVSLAVDNESASSTAANRFTLRSNSGITMPIHGSNGFFYDGTSSRWLELWGSNN